jgi:hypothetical protein
MNFYRYVDNSPVGFTDPDGLMKACCRPVRGLSLKCHCWIVLSDTQTIGSYRFGTYLQRIYNHTDDRPSPPGSTCEDVPGDEKCVRDEFAKEPDQTIYGPTNTSNSAVSRALKKVGYKLPKCAMGRK